MPSSAYRPAMTQARPEAVQPVTAVDEFQNSRELQIAAERPLTIYLDRTEVVTLMTLGTQPELLTLGYLKNQGIIKDLEAIKSVQVDWDVNAAVVTTFAEDTAWQDKLKNRTVTTGCGQGTIFGNIMEEIGNIKLKPFRLKQSAIYELIKNLGRFNDVYKSAGAVHGCALCENIEIITFMEDVGRHNAVDAIAGHMWLENISGSDKLFYTTGRLTSEMVIKVSQMGIPVLLSRSGITQMGLDIAKDVGVVLFSRANGKHFLIYNGAEYVDFDTDLPAKLSVANKVS